MQGTLEHLDLPGDEEFDAFAYLAPPRQSLDACVNAFGHHLLHLCQASGLHILNGRVKGIFQLSSLVTPTLVMV